MPYVETRGGSIRVKWWGGEYKLDDEGKPTKTKKYESSSGPEPGVKFQTEEEARDFGLDREYDVRHGKHIRRVDSSTLMGRYCWDWFDTTDLKPHSVKTYRSILNAVIVPYWETRPVGAITALEYDVWKRHIYATYKGSYPGQVTGLFRMLMDDAVLKYKLRTESPIIENRRRGKYKKRARPAKRSYQMEVIHQLASNAYHVWGFTGWTYIWTVAFTGMRPPGEMYGLQRGFASPNWPATDPDPDRRREALERYRTMPALRVQHQLYYADGKPALADPKYDSHRTLVIPQFLHEMHAALLASHDSPWMFTSATGRSMLGTDFQRIYWHPIRDGAPARSARHDYTRPEVLPVEAMAGKRLYLLRHWHKEMLDEPGDIPRVAVEGRMGHELPGVEGVYSNVSPAMEARIVEYLQGVWEKFWSSGPWFMPTFPKPFPVDQRVESSPQFSDVPIIGER